MSPTPRKKKLLLFIAITSIVMNIGFILFYKYYIKEPLSFNTATDVINSNKALHKHYSYYLYCDTLNELAEDTYVGSAGQCLKARFDDAHLAGSRPPGGLQPDATGC